MSAPLRPSLPRADVAWMRAATQKQLDGCRVRGAGGTWLHTPDGAGNYRALWTRDFCYMVECAGDLFDPREIQASIRYLLAGQRRDGCMPDRVNAAGRGVYSPGGEESPLADHALDNGAFMARLVCAYVGLSGEEAFFAGVEAALRRGLDHTRRAASGLVYNPPEAPQCPYGFTDTIVKTGHLLFCSLLYWDACVHMEELCRQIGCGDAAEYRRRAELVPGDLDRLWCAEEGLFWAADGEGRRLDIWGSALAAHLGCISADRARRIAEYLVAHYQDLVQRGQVRHLPAGQTWERFFVAGGVAPGTYQNGAFWATPLFWVVPVIARRDPELAARTVADAIADFRLHGINECVNGEYCKVPDYVASATSVYALLR